MPHWPLPPAIGRYLSLNQPDAWHACEGSLDDFLHAQLAVNAPAFAKATYNSCAYYNDLDFKHARSSMVVPAIGGHNHVRMYLIISLPQILLAYEEHDEEEAYGVWCQGETVTVIRARRRHKVSGATREAKAKATRSEASH